MNARQYDVAIAGGGAMGLATAYALLKRGKSRVVVLERYEPGHDRAASTDNTKAIRYEYGDSEMYALMVARSLELWRELEAASGADLYVNSGVVCWGRNGNSHAQQSYRTLTRLGIPIREVSPAELCRLYPQFSPADMTYATVNPEGGFLRASDCVAAFASQVVKLGGEIRSHSHVVGIEPSGEQVIVRLADGEAITASQVVLAVGPWAANLLPQLGLRLPLTANKQQVVYIEGLSDEYGPGRFPVFLNLDHEFYGFPLDGAGLLKASIHFPGPVIDPDALSSPDDSFTEHIKSLLGKYIPGAARGRVRLSRTCMYAMTPDEDFILDRLPGWNNVVVGAGFSGHGFKFAPLIGEMLAAMSVEGRESPLVSSFSAARFGIPAYRS